MKLLVLSPVAPDAPSDGDRLRLYRWLEHLARTHELHLACFADPARASDWATDGLLGRLARVERVPRSQWRRRFSAAARLASCAPASVAAEADVRMEDLVDALLAGGRGAPVFDAVLAYRLKMAPYALRFRGPRFLDYTDCMTRYAERLAAARALAGAPGAAWARVQSRRLSAYESWCAGQFDGGFFNARQDRDAVAAMNPAAAKALRVVANGADLDALAAPRGSAASPDPDGLLFVGNLAYPPNADAVEWFARRVLPRVRALRPGAHLTVVGGGASRRLNRLGALPGLSFAGFARDLRPYWRRASVSVCPIRSGAGRQNKLLDAFAAGVPAVATPLAAEGAEANDNEHLLVAGDEAAFADAVVRLLQDPGTGRRMARKALALARGAYDWAANAGALEAALLAGVKARAW